jgi:hypothetical protein
MAPIELPHFGQNARLVISDERKVDGTPPGPVQDTLSRGNSTQAVVSEPECLWHCRHEHVCGLVAGPIAS